MRSILLILLLAVLSVTQLPGKPQPRAKRAPILAFAKDASATPIMDTDVFDEAKYLEESGADSATAKAKRAKHEAVLTREFMNAFNQDKGCDRIVLQAEGENKPDFALQIMVDSHDTPGQKPVWMWVLRDVGKDKLLPTGSDDTSRQAVHDICRTVQKLF
jgi:hypothetical protein